MDRKTADVLAIIGMIGVIVAVFMPFPVNIVLLLISGCLALGGGLFGSRVYGAISGVLLGLQAYISPLTAASLGAGFVGSSNGRSDSAMLDQAHSSGFAILVGTGLLILALSIWGPMAKR